ncbi:GntR family transcriptional regulator [Arthrobacter antioxidans]|uniref:GntR family transcriptional regulator n=1 Tax=Arthrobacter antioxidans TaxID=2895818 RepID=UPI001FFFBDDF|nr:GntR family transcriptional regulator [Arthrobacter antioxidans]
MSRTPPRQATRQPLADQVHSALLGQLLDGRRKPDEVLNLVYLAREFEVSQTPVREALARLEHTGLVLREAHKGYRVAPLFSMDDLRKVMDARLVLEPALAYEAALRVTPEFLERLAGTIGNLETGAQVPDSPPVTSFLRADEQFHAAIAHQADNSFLEDAWRSFGGQAQRFRLYARTNSTAPTTTAAEHRAILDAFTRRDAEGASSAIRVHIENAKVRALQDRRVVASED